VIKNRKGLHPNDFDGTKTVNEIISALHKKITELLQDDCLHIFLFNNLTDQFVAAPGDCGNPTSDLQFSPKSSLVNVLTKRKGPVYKREIVSGLYAIDNDLARVELLPSEIFIPLHGKDQLVGWIGLIERSNKASFSEQEYLEINAIAYQAVNALDRVQTAQAMEIRAQEMAVLTRVAQGVNVTLELDDIYELVFAQTTQIIHAEEYQIHLFETVQKKPRLVFSVKGDQRIPGEEKPAYPDHMPEFEAICSGKAFRSKDYSREKRDHGYEEQSEGIFAWLAVPLRAGAEIIGSISVGKHDLTDDFTIGQQQTLQSIADLAAGAIVKAQLLSESEKRTHQLKTLYDMTRQLTSTLDQELLLKNILQNAVDILDCEAGSLLMIDEQTNELVFRVALGPVAPNLVNKRMPFNAGVAGKSFTKKEAFIVNDVHASNIWFEKNDQSTGFVTHSVLVVPMRVKDRVLGVIEVINRKSGTSFTIEDQELLFAFASQAAVAVENSQLYTMTDQALAARVEELSVMQRIDRELNTSLDVNRAMNITLDWAMRQSGATAGLIGMVEPEGIQLMASHGYKNELNEYEETFIPAQKVHLNNLSSGGKPVQFSMDDSRETLLQDAKSQVVIPIQREKVVTGVILLESSQLELCTEEELGFLMRLGDHASIAIANAQLYNAVQAANVAKSEFVSFVAHELKNPMTSIKGYTELLAARAVGPVNETQGNFLQVIRSNIDRMNTLVSDLNDLTKIEAGRLRLELSSMAFMDIVNEADRSTRRQIEEKNQLIRLQIPEDLPQVYSDRNRLMQILINLVSNAHKYTESGGEIVLGAAVSEGKKGSKATPKFVHVWVKDNGIGITPDDQVKIFQKFFRSEDPKTRENPGAGLGLNITRSLVEMQGGKIWFESEYRKGTTFHFTIPIAK
jgi:signal transduction histidine kinase